jgi:hypothetical protein
MMWISFVIVFVSGITVGLNIAHVLQLRRERP